MARTSAGARSSSTRRRTKARRRARAASAPPSVVTRTGARRRADSGCAVRLSRCLAAVRAVAAAAGHGVASGTVAAPPWPLARAGRSPRVDRVAARDGRVPRLPSAGRLARAVRPGKGEALSRLELLVAADPGVRRSQGEAGAHGPCAGGARGKSDRPDVHWRSQRRLPLCGAPSSGVRQPADQLPRGRWLAVVRRVHRRALPLRPAGELARARGATQVQRVARRRAWLLEKGPGAARP